MGTNYYVKVVASEPRICSECGMFRETELLHIGKSSCGWCFSLHVIQDRGLTSLDAWAALLKSLDDLERCEIQDEYGTELSCDEMMAIIMDREGVSDSPHPYSDSWLEANQAEWGPKGLLRHRVQGNCIGHGAGTWDLLTGEFF